MLFLQKYFFSLQRILQHKMTQNKVDEVSGFCYLLLIRNFALLNQILTSQKTLISLDIMCVSVFYCSLILLKFNKENVFSKLRKSTLKMKRSTQEPRAAWAHQVEH